MNIHLQTKCFTIRDIEESDLEGMFDLDSNPNVHKFLGNSPIKTREEAKSMIENIRTQYQTNSIGRWAIADKNTNEFIGWTGFKYEQIVRPEFGYIDFGFRLREQFWGKGIATETALACLNYGFEKLSFQDVYACAGIDHIASNKVLQKIGFNYLEDFKYGSFELHWYGLNISEWQSKNFR